MIMDTKLEFRKGMTLIELLLSLAMLGSIVALLLTSFSQTRKQQDRLKAEIEMRQEMRILFRVLAKDFESAVYLENFMGGKPVQYKKSGIFGENDDSLEFARDKVHMHVHRRAFNHRGVPLYKDPELHEVSYYLEENDEGVPEFIRREEFYIDTDITAGDRSLFLKLTDHLIGFDVQYVKQNIVDDWQDNWDSSAIKSQYDWMPQAVKITLLMKTPSGDKLEETREFNIRPNYGTKIRWGY